MPDWLQAALAAVVANLIAWPVIFAVKRIRERVAEARDVVEDAISDAIDVLDGWPTDDEPDDELYCDCGECWPQTPTGLPRRVPTGAHDLLDVQPMERAQEIAALEALYDMPSYIRPPVSPGRDQ